MYALELPDDPRTRYRVLELVKDNRAYRDLQRLLPGVAAPEDYGRIQALENPALQAVRFHVIHIFPGTLAEALPVIGEGAMVDGANRILRWSNMGSNKDAVVDDAATYGDTFLKAMSKEDGTQAYLENRHPGEVTEFTEDRLRNVKRIRLDVELKEKGPNDSTWWTEVWDHDQNLYLSYYHKRGAGSKLEDLGAPYENDAITNFGYDFVPFVRVPFDNGARPGRRSRGVFDLHVEAIDELNRNATHARRMWRDNAEGLWAALRNEAGEGAIDFKNVEEPGPPEEHEAHGRKMVRFPGVARMEDMVPSINYGAALDMDDNGRKKLERSMAELRYWRENDKGDPSAAALRQHVAPAIRTAESAKGAAEDAILKGVKMCLTMGRDRKLFARGIGDFASGTFDELGFEKRPVFPESPMEVAVREAAQADALASAKSVSPEYLYEVLIEKGWDEQKARRVVDSRSGQSELQRIMSGALEK